MTQKWTDITMCNSSSSLSLIKTKMSALESLKDVCLDYVRQTDRELSSVLSQKFKHIIIAVVRNSNKKLCSNSNHKDNYEGRQSETAHLLYLYLLK